MECKSIVVLSDTHDNTEILIGALDQIQQLEYQKILHCGDITTPETLSLFEGLPVEAVFGNCDYDTSSLQEAAKNLGISPLNYTKELTLADKKIAFLHGDNQGTLSHLIHSQAFDYIFHGHTHERKDIRHEKTRIINPGALQRAPEYTFAYLHLETGDLEFHHVQG